MLRWLFAVVAALALALPGAGVAFAQGNDPSTVIEVAGVRVDLCKVSGDVAAIVAFVNTQGPTGGAVNAAAVTEKLAGLSLDSRRLGCQKPTTTPSATPTPGPKPNPTIRDSCADYARHGEFNFRRGDDRYRPALDRDNDGVACEPGNDDDLNLGRDRSLDGRTCDELKRDFDRSEQAVEDARTNLNRVLRDARRDVSPEGNNLSAEERRDIRTAERVVDDRTGDRDRVRDFRKDVCKDDGGDVTINVHVDPVPVEVNNDPNPLPSSSGGQVSRVPSGGVETGGSEPESNSRALGFAGLALMFPTGALVYRLIRRDA